MATVDKIPNARKSYMVSKFQKTGFGKGSTYICSVCGKRTRETGFCESGVGLCAKCYEEGGLENEHSDYGHPKYNPSCPTCREEKAAKNKTTTT